MTMVTMKYSTQVGLSNTLRDRIMFSLQDELPKKARRATALRTRSDRSKCHAKVPSWLSSPRQLRLIVPTLLIFQVHLHEMADLYSARDRVDSIIPVFLIARIAEEVCRNYTSDFKQPFDFLTTRLLASESIFRPSKRSLHTLRIPRTSSNVDVL